ncbi:MAG: CHAT domain-containing protein [Acidobacteria bacterium]|nr:CHAT domain-containing protein [Acidobacteriota bacterium]
MNSRLTSLPLLILLWTACLSAAQGVAAQSDAAKPQSLSPNQSLQTEIKYGEQHFYQVYVAQGQLLRIDFSSAEVLVEAVVVSDSHDWKQRDGLLKLPAAGKVLYLAEKTGWQIICVNRKGKKEQQGRYSLNVQVEAHPTAEEHTYAVAQQQLGRVWSLYYQGTEEALTQAIIKGEELRNTWRQRQNQRYEATAAYFLGETYKSKEQFPAALEAFQHALIYFQAENIPRYQAIILTSMGQIYATWSDYARASEFYQQALPLWRQGDETASINMIGWNLLNLGHAYRAYGEWAKAIECYQQAHQCYEEYSLTGSTTEQARGFGIVAASLGSIYLARGEKQTALTYLKQAVEHFKQGQNAENEYAMYGRIGDVYSSLGEYDQARGSYEQALQHYRQTKSLHEATILNSYGNLHRLTGAYEPAIEKLNQSLTIRRQLGDRRGQALTLTNLGAVFASQQQYQQALYAYREAQELWQDIGDKYSQGYTLNYLGLANYELKETAQAREFFQQALVLRRATNDREGEANTRYNLARLDFETGKIQAARQQIEAALTLSESVRATVVNEDLRASYLASVRDYYEFYVSVLMRLHQLEPSAGHHKEAFKVSEMARARSLLEILSENRLALRQGISPLLLKQEQDLQQRLNAKAEYQRALQNKKAAAELLTAAERELQALTSELKEIRSQITTASPHYAELTQYQLLEAEQLQKQLLDANSLLLAYTLGQERSYLWAISQDQVASYELPGREIIEAAARQSYELLQSRHELSDPQKLNESLMTLSKLVLSPVREKLKQQRLLIVADGALQYVPFGALPVSRDEVGRMRDEKSGVAVINHPSSLIPHPLIVDHEITNLPSATLLAALRHETSLRKKPERTIAVFADPVFDKDDVRLASVKAPSSGRLVTSSPALTQALRDVDVSESSLPRLPFTRREAEAIIPLVSAAQRKTAFDFAANRETLLQSDLSQYRILHFATHGLLNSKHPELSGLVFSLVDETGKSKDGFLRLHEIYNLKLNADLVVLSACQTGLGKEIRGEGLIGLTRGFMYAGASNVISSLWKVNDKATSELMKAFYQELLGAKKQSPAAALRAAQLTLLKQKRWEHPSYWAAFALQGDWQ